MLIKKVKIRKKKGYPKEKEKSRKGELKEKQQKYKERFYYV